MTDIDTYFRAEKAESLVFLTVGIAAIVFATVAWIKWNEPFIKGMAVPMALIGLVQIMVGGTVYARTDKQVATLTEQRERDPQAYRAAETLRMQNVMKSFKAIKWMEIAFILAGVVLITFTTGGGFWKGLGIGLLLQAAVSLTLDVFAEERGRDHLQAVQANA